MLLVDTRSECGEAEQLSAYHFREARFLRTLRLEINGHSPWVCEATAREPHTYLGVEPQPVPPVYAPEVVSEVTARFAPRLADLYMERWSFDSQETDKPIDGRADNLYDPLPTPGAVTP